MSRRGRGAEEAGVEGPGEKKKKGSFVKAASGNQD